MKLTRRTFLAAVGTVASGAPGVVRSAERIPAPKASPMKLGMVTYNLGKDWDVETLIKNCQAARFEGVELRTTHGHKVEVGLTAAERATVKKRFEDSPVRLYGLGSAFDYHTPDAAKLRADIEATKEYIVLARDVGATGVKVRPNGLPKEVPVERTLEQIGTALREVARFGADHGQVIRLEVHGTGTSLLPNIRRILDVANHPNLGVCWNSNQTDLDGEGFDANFERVEGRIVEVHLRDLFLEEYPWRRLFSRLLASGYTGYCLAEIPESRDPVRVMQYFRSLWLAYQGLV
ncbi:MAG: sugar phosphate isomerase/epimerase [Verrucomicrobiales bacterium]|nr:sugar phosphate isomerase/epimerase [Verrucomicrobiales bacterium]